jgi:uncharacterized metal-binding protein
MVTICSACMQNCVRKQLCESGVQILRWYLWCQREIYSSAFALLKINGCKYEIGKKMLGSDDMTH